MRIPSDAHITREKLTKYLLVHRPWDDKSKFLRSAGFSVDEPDELMHAIRATTAESDAAQDGENDYGVFYRVEGNLDGPNGRSLPVVLIWLEWFKDGSFHFITLKPAKV